MRMKKVNLGNEQDKRPRVSIVTYRYDTSNSIAAGYEQMAADFLTKLGGITCRS